MLIKGIEPDVSGIGSSVVFSPPSSFVSAASIFTTFSRPLSDFELENSIFDFFPAGSSSLVVESTAEEVEIPAPFKDLFFCMQNYGTY